MNPSILVAIRWSLMFLVPSVAYAISAQWDLDPISGDWNAADNWTPNGVPNGPADTATFGLSNTTNVSISEDTEVNGITFTSAATNPYTITASPGLTLTISGTGITNNSGTTQTFVTGVDASRNSGMIVFSNSATAGSNVFIRNDGGSTNFFNNSTAGGAGISNEGGGATNFFNGWIECGTLAPGSVVPSSDLSVTGLTTGRKKKAQHMNQPVQLKTAAPSLRNLRNLVSCSPRCGKYERQSKR
jgi:hypothetical protein